MPRLAPRDMAIDMQFYVSSHGTGNEAGVRPSGVSAMEMPS